MVPYEDFTVILPTLNEARNIGELIKTISAYYKGIFIIVSDDGSSDNTKEIVRALQNSRAFFLDRKNARIHGLTASILEASKEVKTKYFMVMDADNQHPWEKLGEIAGYLRKGAKLVIASRERVEGKWEIPRKYISYLGNMLGKISLAARGKWFASYDVLTGFYGVETGFWKYVVFERKNFGRFKLKGYKILFEFLKVIPGKITVKNVSYVFNIRKMGFSKLNGRIYLEFLKALFA
ncbi:MAG: glycosyltransferase [Candidatus Omnitrophica bacterium]|nr:glycosyltransferase [Candidatus Omnitrophota bacterium]